MTSILCAVCELPISPEESFAQALEVRHQHLYPDQCIRLLRDDLAEVKAQMSGELWNLSQQNAALREDNARLVEALESIRNWRPPDGTLLQVKDLQWFKDIDATRKEQG